MSAPISNSRLRVPHGFQALLEGFTREVLRNQPSDIYSFGALYFEEMLRRREETGEEDPAQLALRLQDRLRNGAKFGDGRVIGDVSDERQQQASVVIQSDFRRRAAQREAEQLRRDRAAGDIQAAVRGHQERRNGDSATRDDQDAAEEDEVDIDLNDPEVAAAAEKIQAGFKGYKTRKQMKNQDKKKPDEDEVDIDLNDPEVGAAAEKIQAGFKGYKTRKQMKQQQQKEPPKQSEDEVDIDLTDPEVGAAAEKIQAGFKGYKTRKQMKQQQQQSSKPSGENATDEVDIDLTDPEVGAAAEKIQAGFKGYKTRKQMKQQKQEQQTKPAEADTEVDIDLTDPEVGAAAEKIQAGFKGYKTRKQMKQQQDEKQQSEAKADEEEVDIDLTDPEVGAAAEKIQAGFKGYKTRKQMKQRQQDAEEEQHQRDLLAAEAAGHSAEEEAAAAARIQAGFKGYQTRKHLAEAKEHEQPQQQPEQHSQHPSADEHLDVDESDPRVNQAATKIQAGFKGMQARKEVKELRKHKDEEASAATTGRNAAEDGNHLHGNVEQPSAEEQNAAAAKIQAGFKGYKTRKEMGLLHEQEGHGEQQQQHQEDEANS